MFRAGGRALNRTSSAPRYIRYANRTIVPKTKEHLHHQHVEIFGDTALIIQQGQGNPASNVIFWLIFDARMVVHLQHKWQGHL